MRAKPDSLLRRHPVAAYSILTFAISWLAALAVLAPALARPAPVAKTIGLIVFPAMLFGPSISGILLTWLLDGREGLRELFSRLRRWRVAPRWYGLLLLPPGLVAAVLLFLKFTISPEFSPNKFYIGFLFGIPAGIFEEVGWTGFAFPKMILRRNPLVAAILLGLLWSLWHLPAINFLGASAPHGPYWLPFFFAFALAMTAMRVLICWQYASTKSVLLAQLMHISSTGSLVLFSPPVASTQETIWYAIYGCALWAVVGIIVAKTGRELQSGKRGPAVIT